MNETVEFLQRNVAAFWFNLAVILALFLLAQPLWLMFLRKWWKPAESEPVRAFEARSYRQSLRALLLALLLTALPGLITTELFVLALLSILALGTVILLSLTLDAAAEAEEAPAVEFHWGGFGGGVHGLIIRRHAVLAAMSVMMLAMFLMLASDAVQSRLPRSGTPAETHQNEHAESPQADSGSTSVSKAGTASQTADSSAGGAGK